MLLKVELSSDIQSHDHRSEGTKTKVPIQILLLVLKTQEYIL